MLTLLAFLLAHGAELVNGLAVLYLILCLIVGVLRAPRGGRAQALLQLLGRLSLLTFRDAPGTLKVPLARQPEHKPPEIPAELPPPLFPMDLPPGPVAMLPPQPAGAVPIPLGEQDTQPLAVVAVPIPASITQSYPPGRRHG